MADFIVASSPGGSEHVAQDKRGRSHFPQQLPRRSLVSLGITLVWLLIAASPFTIWPQPQFERWLYDKRMELTAPKGFDRRVVIVDIDEASLAREGYWPW
ncbi:MAG TPA: CHASE2 domain-containing protein, partial [Gammaproteobacteria bacterium]|nr:CHASE2 domain-containing protein [Gammaproteobacteria bacterium]